jgi:two-component sensor histidine kinase
VVWVFDKKTRSYIKKLPDSISMARGMMYPTGIEAVLQDKDGSYWIGRENLPHYDEHRKKIEYTVSSKEFSFPIHDDNNGMIWMGTNNSLCSYNKKTKELKLYPYPLHTDNLPYMFIEAIYQQNDSIFWLGTINGLFRFNKNTGKWKQYKNNPADTSSLSYDIIFSLCADPVHPDKYLWIGTNGGGLNRFNFTTEKFLHYTTKDGLPNDVVYGVLSDDGNLWMSTNKGLSKFNSPSGGAGGGFQNYETKDGLQSNEFNRYAFCKTRDGTLFFGGVNGFNYFNPRELTNNKTLPNVVITDLKIANKIVTIHSKENILQKPVYLTDKIVLEYEYNMISFDFAAMDFSQPEKNLYQYKLDGFDDEWIQSGTQHSATYTNLDPGTYTFHVKGSNSDGVWNESGTSIQLTILPPWYMTWWFRAAVAIIILSGAYAFYRYRLSHALKLQAVRNRIASDLHDEIGSNLSNISIFSNVAQQKAKAANDDTMLLQKITEYTHVSMEAMSDIVWMINSRNDRFENIIVRMRSLAAEIFEATNCRLHIHFDERLNHIKLNMEERKNFYLIYKESVNNIAKYADCKEVWIEMKMNHNKVTLNIRDNGKGFDMLNGNRGNGLFNMKKRAEALNGKLNVVSDVGKGTLIELSFEV